MLEVLYNIDTKLVNGWCADESQFGNFTPDIHQDIVILPVPIPPESDIYHVNLVQMIIVPNPDYDPLSPDIRRASLLLSTSPDVITQPEMWELMRIFGRLHGIPY